MLNFVRHKIFRQRLLIASAVILLIAVLIFFICYFLLRASWISRAQNLGVQISRTIEQNLQAEDDLLTLQINNAYASRQLMDDIELIFAALTFDEYLAGRLARSQSTREFLRSFPEYIRTYIRQHRNSLYKLVFHGKQNAHVMYFGVGEILYSFDVPSDDWALAPCIDSGFVIRKTIYNPARGYEKIGDISFHFRLDGILSGIDDAGLAFFALRDYDGNYHLKGGNSDDEPLIEHIAGLDNSSGSVRTGLLNYMHFTKQNFDRYQYQIIIGIDDRTMIADNFLVTLALIAAVVAVSVVAFFLAAARIRYDYSASELKIRQKQAEMRALQSQINPHFLYNTLEAISSQALINNDEPTADAITALGSLFRDTTNTPPQISMKDEMRILETYLKIMKSRYDENFSYQIILEPNVEDFQTLKFWTQPLAENFFKHGFDHDSSYNLLVVRGYMDKDAVCVDILNNGAAIPDEDLRAINKNMRSLDESDNSNIGIKNVYNRLRFFYGDKFSLSVSNNRDGGVIIKMRVEGGGANVQFADS